METFPFSFALDRHIAVKGMREIAEDLYGAERVAAEWGPDSGLRARTRRLIGKAQGHAGSRGAMPGASSPK